LLFEILITLYTNFFKEVLQCESKKLEDCVQL